MIELTYEELIRIHDETLARHGGLPGVKDEGFLLSALDQPRMSAFGQDAYPTITDKAAALGFSLAKNHAFHDGNKRVAFFAMYAFLGKNGYLLEVPDQEAIDFMLSLAASQVGREDLVFWLEDYVVPHIPYTLDDFENAMNGFGVQLEALGGYLDEIGEIADACTNKFNAMQKWVGISNVPVRIQMRRCFEAYSLEAEGIAQKIRIVLEPIKAYIEVFDYFAPYVSHVAENPSPSERIDLIIDYGILLNSSDSAVNSMTRLAVGAKNLNMLIETEKATGNSLVEALNDVCDVFNQNWFAVRDVLEEFKRKIPRDLET